MSSRLPQLAPGETGDMFVITCHVPTTNAEGLHVSAAGTTVTVAGPHGFRQQFELSQEANTRHLHWEVFDGILELRAPNGAAD
jgi:HSP20 family molecular chaperone IbpA